jgi:hypothetical protein
MRSLFSAGFVLVSLAFAAPALAAPPVAAPAAPAPPAPKAPVAPAAKLPAKVTFTRLDGGVKKTWNAARKGEVSFDLDTAVLADASEGHNQWYADRQAGTKANVPNPKPIKPKFLPAGDIKENFEKLNAMYPGMDLVTNEQGIPTGIKQDINRPVKEVYPGLNKQLNGTIAQNRANRIEKALKSGRSLSPALRRELAAADHDDWMGGEMYTFAGEAESNGALNAEMKEALGFDAQAIRAAGKDPGGEIYNVPLAKLVDFAKASQAPVSAKFSETRSQYRPFGELTKAEQDKDLAKVNATLNRLGDGAKRK